MEGRPPLTLLLRVVLSNRVIDDLMVAVVAHVCPLLLLSSSFTLLRRRVMSLPHENGLHMEDIYSHTKLTITAAVFKGVAFLAGPPYKMSGSERRPRKSTVHIFVRRVVTFY